MGIKFENGGAGKWNELIVGWKWPHQGFTIGYDFVEPEENHKDNEMVYYTLLVYLGPLSLIYNWGNHKWDE